MPRNMYMVTDSTGKN